ncbi:MAG TPA: adenylate/guanylate cyclase domain-containing protein [Candidatus Baltobacteraceae bacterium]|nr:adenylate/guanylate cyclase domain-containing protein [Candidatus Baltobacteraceae bacterium]
MTLATAAAAGALAVLALAAAGSGRALRRPRETLEAAVGATVALIALVLEKVNGYEGVLTGVALVLGIAAAARFAQSVIDASRDASSRLFALLEKENAAKSRFLPRTLVDRLGRGSLAEVVLGDRATEPMTVLFADIRDSTALTERLSSEKAFELIAEFFARSARIVRDHHGSVDRYLGDGYMALFPRRVEDALDAALAIQSEVASLNAEEHWPRIEVGLGLHTGPVTFGTVGDARHLDTTIVSDTANTAKRVEGLSKRLRAPVVATGDVMHAVRDRTRYVVSQLGPQHVRGKSEPIEVFSIAARPVLQERRLRTITGTVDPSPPPRPARTP